MWFKIFKALTKPGTLIFLALIALSIGFGLQIAVGAGVLSITIFSAAAPILLGAFLGLVLAAAIAAVVWGAYYFYHDYQKEKILDEELRKILTESLSLHSLKQGYESDSGAELEEELAISQPINNTGKDVRKKLLRDYNVKTFADLTEAKQAEILARKFSYQKAFFYACRDWCMAHEKAIIIAGILLVAFMITIIVLISLFAAGVPVPIFVSLSVNGLVGFFEAGFVGLGLAASSAFATHHLLTTLLTGIVFCLGPINIVSTLQRVGSVFHDSIMSFIRKHWVEKPDLAEHNEDNPTENQTATPLAVLNQSESISISSFPVFNSPSQEEKTDNNLQKTTGIRLEQVKK